MKSEKQINERLSEAWERYRSVSSDNIDPELKAQIRELRWVLEDGKYISHDG